jgi:hypothetical protein
MRDRLANDERMAASFDAERVRQVEDTIADGAGTD